MLRIEEVVLFLITKGSIAVFSSVADRQNPIN
jgi:hypothetical protein